MPASLPASRECWPSLVFHNEMRRTTNSPEGRIRGTMSGVREFPARLHHSIPGWVKDGAVFHIRVRAAPGFRLIDGAHHQPQAILDAIESYHASGRWFCRYCVVMPDHLHAMISFRSDCPMSRVVGSWKSYLTRRSGIRWQAGYFDHRLRSEKEADECWEYLRRNPVAAGLVSKAEDWPWSFFPSNYSRNPSH